MIATGTASPIAGRRSTTCHSRSTRPARTRTDDGFKNRAEWRAKTDPRDSDSDSDGVDDSDENAGEVTAYADGELTIKLFATGEEVTATVTEDTEVQCGCDDGSKASKSGDDPDDDHGGRGHADDDEDDPHPDRGEDDEHGHHGERGHGEDDSHHDGRHDDDGEDCGDDALAVGALVEEADLKLTAEGKVWREIELR